MGNHEMIRLEGAWAIWWRPYSADAAGYTVTRAAGGLGAWYLIGVSASDVALLQVKSNRPPRRPQNPKPCDCSSHRPTPAS